MTDSHIVSRIIISYTIAIEEPPRGVSFLSSGH